ncbi:MAG: hypothetical protein GC192_14965 [Bacteroidetes bacterium]|nr:hypothetical protein [Bacteroidota bacterium]
MIEIKEGDVIIKVDRYKRKCSLKDLFEKFEPLVLEPLATQHETMVNILPLAAPVYEMLSENGRLCYDFWKQLEPKRIKQKKFSYSKKVMDNFKWEVKLTPKGILYKDITGEYLKTGKIYEQLLSDFWLYGPRMPISELAIREEMVEGIRNALKQEGPVTNRHFDLFEYPSTYSRLSWTVGDRTVEDFVIVRDYGIDIGETNWHDGTVFLDFVSFERFLKGHGLDEQYFRPKVKTAILKHLKNALQASNP